MLIFYTKEDYPAIDLAHLNFRLSCNNMTTNKWSKPEKLSQTTKIVSNNFT